MQELTFVVVIGLTSIIMAVFFFIRGLYRYKAWHNGEKDELWTFLALIIGGIVLILIGLPVALFGIPATDQFLSATSPVLIILSLVPIGLYTFYYFLKWWRTK